MHGHVKQGSLFQYGVFSTLPVRVPCLSILMEGWIGSAIASERERERDYNALASQQV